MRLDYYFQKFCEISIPDWLTAIGTVGAVIVALGVNWWNNKPKKSNLIVKGISIVNQDNAETEEEKNSPRLLSVGRIIIHNNGKYKASSVEACIEKIYFEGKEREDFFPMPLVWTHGQLNKKGHTIRDIYPNQTVYLDIFNQIYDNYYVGENIVKLAVAAGLDNDNLSGMNLGESELLIKLYQESGQVNEIHLKTVWDSKNIPTISIVNS